MSPQTTIHPGHATAAHRIMTGRAPDLAGTDVDRAARVAAAHLPWLAHLPTTERDSCLDEVVTALVAREPLDGLLGRWADIAARHRADRTSTFR